MLIQPEYAMDSMRDVRRLVHENGWAVLVTQSLCASHLPCLLDPEHDPGGEAPDLVLLGHTARADPASQELLDGGEVLLVFQGENGYVSPSWYEAGPYVPTWNFLAVHVYGTPDALTGEDGFAVLERTVEHFEARRESPWRLDSESLPYAQRIARGTVPFRLRAARVHAKAKLSQDQTPEIQDRVIAALDRPGPYRRPELAAEMRRTLGKG